MIAEDCIVPNDNIEDRTTIFVKADFDAVILVIADNIVFNGGFRSAIQVNAIVNVIFIQVSAVESPAVLVVNAILIMQKAIIQDLERSTVR